jgi:hypothetical protein
MSDIHDEANVFAIPDFWANSKWLEQLDRESPASFFSTHFRGMFADLARITGLDTGSKLTQHHS